VKGAIRLACAMALLSYFQSESDVLIPGKDAQKLALKFYVEEVAVRSKERFDPRPILERLGCNI